MIIFRGIFRGCRLCKKRRIFSNDFFKCRANVLKYIDLLFRGGVWQFCIPKNVRFKVQKKMTRPK